MRCGQRAGVTKAEIVIVLVIAIAFIAAIQLIRPHRPRYTMKDAAQLRGIEMGFLQFARENNGMYPIPGLLKRLPVDGISIPGRGEEDITQNTTANLFSSCVMEMASFPLPMPPSRSPKR